MRKVAILTEGQSELIFIRYLIGILYTIGKVNFECLKLVGDNLSPVHYKTSYPNAEIYILIVNIGNDNRVISEINNREVGLFQNGYEVVIGLRDMYCDLYCKQAKIIDINLNQRIIQGHLLQIQEMQNSENIFMFFEIMEFEAWLLAMYNLFSKVDDRLTVDYIDQKLGINLRNINPEIEFFHPTENISQIFSLVDISYDKTEQLMESILSRISDCDIFDANENGRCGSFRNLLQKLEEIT